MFKKILLGALAWMILSSTAWAAPAPTPQSQLLLPFFEVSLEGLDRMTFFAIVNASDEEIFLTASIYSNWAVKMLEIPFSIKANEVSSINLHDWLIAGNLPQGVKVCAGGVNDCMDLVHLRTVLAGEPSPMTSMYYGTELEKGVATGFVTIKAEREFLPESDVLWGDYFYTNPEEDFAQGQRLVRLEAGLSCADLCQRHSIRFLEGGGFSGGTKLTIWNWDGVERSPSEFPTPNFKLENAHIDVYSQKGEIVDVLPQLQVLPVQTLLVDELDIRQDFGWLDLTTFQHSTIAGYYRAMGRFSVGVPSWCLPCDPCNEFGPCYQPANPECGGTPCVKPRIAVTGDRTATVGTDFLLIYNVTGSPPNEVFVSELPNGLLHSGNRIFGVPTEAKDFTISVQNDCGFYDVRVFFGPPTESYLTLIKTVVNDHGGTATVDDFPLFVSGEQVASGERRLFAPGAYQASEQNLSGYAAGSWSGDCAADGSVTLHDGDDKVCFITNDDVPARLTLIKQVINDDGGTAQPGDFPLFVNGQQVTTGVAVELAAGTYTASEQNLTGYQALPWTGDCASNGGVTLALGDDKTCVITNDDIDSGPEPSFLTVTKIVINDDGGAAQPDDFGLHYTNPTIGRVNVVSGSRNFVAEGTYTVGENNLPGYQAGTWGGDCAADGTVVINEGDDKECTITNDDAKSTITLIKHVINDDGGTATAGDFLLRVSGQQVSSGVAVSLPPGTYAASEQNLPGYQAGTWGGDCASNGTVTLGQGENKVCEITNDDVYVCDPTPAMTISNGDVDYNSSPHNGYHHTEVSYNYSLEGEFNGEVQIYWENGGSTFIKKRKSIYRDCEDAATSGSLFWESDSKSHHPDHGARYFARLVVGGTVIESIPLN